MKNLFKNLMLVAVAAIAFTACTENNEEVNAVTKKVVLEFVADLADDDTRVAFGEKDGNKYPAVWEVSDNVTVKVGEKQASYTLTEEDVLESGKKAIIRPVFELVGDETLSGDIVATVNEYVSFDNHQGNKPTISLKAEAVYPATTLAFEHQYAYGKMELVGLPAEFNVTEVKLNLVGSGNTLNHTINGYSVEDNIFWFTTEAMEAVESFSVYASNGAETYYKEVTVEKAFAFEVGHVSAFRVKDLIVKPADFNVQLTKITSMSDNVIRFEGDNAEDNITISFNPGLENIVAGHYDAVLTYVGFTNDSALEVYDEFEGSSVDVNAAGGGAWYYSANGVDVTVDGDVYTIVAHLMNYCNPGGNKTVDFTYVGKLEFYDYTSARVSGEWGSNNDDKLISFTSVAGKEDFHVNFYGRSFSGNSIAAGNYSIGDGIYGYGIYLGDYFGEGDVKSAYTGNLSVTIVDGCYVMVFTDLKDYYGNMLAERITFKGLIDGLDAPSGSAPEPTDPVQLAAPTASASEITANSITVSWNAVANASNYAVAINGGAEQTISATSYTFTGLEAETSYVITVVAKGNGAEYLDSAAATVNATTSAAQTGGGEPGTPEGTESNPYVYACNVEYQSLMGGYYKLNFTCETEGSFDLYFETYNANLDNFVSSSLSDSQKFYNPKITGYTKTWAADESTISITKITDKTYSVDIKISTFDGYVYYTCPSVVFP